MRKVLFSIAASVVIAVAGATGAAAYEEPIDPCSGYEAIVQDRKGNWVYNPKWLKCVDTHYGSGSTL